MKIVKKAIGIVIILSLCLALIGTISVSAQNFVPGYFGWIGQETILPDDAVNGDRLQIHFDIYIDPEYWASPFSAELIFGLEGFSDVLDILQVRSDVALGVLNPAMFQTLLLFEARHDRLPNQETGFFGRITLISEIVDVELLRERLEASSNNRLAISIRYGQFRYWDHSSNTYFLRDDASFLPRGWTTMADVVHIMDLANQNHTLFAPATITTQTPRPRVAVETVSPSGNEVEVTLNRQLLGNEVLIVAVYRDDKIWSVDINPRQSQLSANEYIATFDIAIPEEIGVEVAAFVWAGLNTMMPLCDPKAVIWNGANWIVRM